MSFLIPDLWAVVASDHLVMACYSEGPRSEDLP